MSETFLAFCLFLIVINVSTATDSASPSRNGYTNSSGIVKSRIKRYLIFQPGSRIMFRINVKDDFFPVTRIFSHGWGFRANIDLLQPARPGHKIRRREVYDTFEELINQHGLDGRACLLKTFCDASNPTPPQSGMLFKIFKLIFTQQETSDNNNISSNHDQGYPHDCEELQKLCPLSLLEMTPYTDI